MNKRLLFGSGAATLILSAVIIFNSEDKQTTTSNLAVPEESSHKQAITIANTKYPEFPSKAIRSGKDTFPEITNTPKPDAQEAASRPIVEAVFIDELLAIFEDGVVFDNNQKVALDIFISRLPSKLTDTELKQILSQIQANTEDTLGQQLGLTINRMYTLQQAEDSFIQSIQAPSNPEEMNKINTQLALLRLEILGEVLNKVFYPDEQIELSKQFNTDSGSDTPNEKKSPETNHEEPVQWLNKLSKEGLTDAEIDRLVTEKYGEQTSSSLKNLQAVEDEWFERYLKFSEEKRYIQEAGLSDEDKTVQIEALLKAHYSLEELKGAAAFDKLMSE